ncbi:HEPN domain-containing protein [Okeania sp. KiyG1]|uniref:HEPN domain-containing protein n=1 Tax=Okeania sp. KiyG1 TaxID=2720165 RepID=UPI00192444DF|nr:hypothetical protein CYANOKiyG1_18800 [Okeania sp. KiyG1]
MFRFTDIQDNSQMILESWKYISETLGSILELYMRVYYTPIRHTKDLFLSFAQAIEGFHRIHHNGKYCEYSVFESIRKELEQLLSVELKNHNVKEEYHESILNKIQYWNEFSLKERLENLFKDEKISSCLPDRLFENSDAKDKFVKQVRDTRGSLTHPTGLFHLKCCIRKWGDGGMGWWGDGVTKKALCTILGETVHYK